MSLTKRFRFIQSMRDFFNTQGFLETPTPPAVENPGMETHIHPFSLYSENEKRKKPLYLHTSPEFALKKLLSMENEEFDRIYSLGYVFRDEPKSPIHRNQFLMLEWYRKNQKIEALMQDCENLVESLLSKKQVFESISVEEAFLKFAGIQIFDFLNEDDLYQKIKADYKDVPLQQKLSWEDLYFLLFLNVIEPKLSDIPYLFLTDFPASLSALSKINPKDPRTCKRFELYINGVEIANAFEELTDVKELSLRFKRQEAEKEKLYGYKLHWPNQFMESMARLPESSGIALGVERMYGKIEGAKPIFLC